MEFESRRAEEVGSLTAQITQGNLDNLREYIESSGSFINVYGYVLKGDKRLNGFEAQLKDFMQKTIETRDKFSDISNTLKNDTPVLIRKVAQEYGYVVHVMDFGDEDFFHTLMNGLFQTKRSSSSLLRQDITQALSDNKDVVLRYVPDPPRARL